MKQFLILVAIVLTQYLPIKGFRVSFVSWNVNDNKKFTVYTREIVSQLLKLDQVKELPDVYAITFQENCINCKGSHLERLSTPFIDTLESVSKTNYKLLSITATRESNYCETIYCLPLGTLHGTTFIMVLLKSNLLASNPFTKTVSGCSNSLLANNEKGITVIGFNLDSTNICLGGLHLDVGKVKNRQTCFDDILSKLSNKCDVTFFGGDFNTRPKDKSESVPSYFDGGRNETFLNELRRTDELSGSEPFSGGVNLLNYIAQKKGKQFIEPFNEFPKFKPTYSIKASLECEDVPVCYVPTRYPSWTDRIIYHPASKVKCLEYSIIPNLGYLSDHIPVFANCQVL